MAQNHIRVEQITAERRKSQYKWQTLYKPITYNILLDFFRNLQFDGLNVTEIGCTTSVAGSRL
jgi:hypothetical protein